MKPFHTPPTFLHSPGITTVVLLSCWLFLWTGSAWGTVTEQHQLVDKARHTLESFMDDPYFSWFHAHVKDAKALLIIPQLLKGAFLIGANGGSGVLIVRNPDSNEWSQPAFYVLGGLSFGFQAGGQASEVIIIARTAGAVEKLYASSLTLGGDVSIAAGPYGAGIEGSTSANLQADFLSFSRSKGVFAGISFEGALIYASDDANHTYYGKAVRPVDILLKNSLKTPHADALRQAAAQAAAY